MQNPNDYAFENHRLIGTGDDVIDLTEGANYSSEPDTDDDYDPFYDELLVDNDEPDLLGEEVTEDFPF